MSIETQISEGLGLDEDSSNTEQAGRITGALLATPLFGAGRVVEEYQDQPEANQYDQDGDGVMDENVYNNIYDDKDESYGTVVSGETAETLSGFNMDGVISEDRLQGAPDFGTIHGDTELEARQQAVDAGFNTTESTGGDSPDYQERWNGWAEELGEWIEANPAVSAFIGISVILIGYAIVDSGTEAVVGEIL